MAKFEYKVLSSDAKGFWSGKVNHEAFEKELTALGNDGWELVNSLPSAQDFGGTRYVLSIFKRAL